MNIVIRQELISDYKATEAVVRLAFENEEYSDQSEHYLVSRIRKTKAFIPELSLVAVNNASQEVVGHILLSKIKIVNENQKIESLALAPLAVLPEYQNKGVGKLLIHEALAKAKQLNHGSVIVMGHPAYYPKFAFKTAADFGINPPFEVPKEAFMAIELEENALNNVSGVVEYPSVFFE